MIKKIKIILYMAFFLINYLISNTSEASVNNKLSSIAARTPITEYEINSKINMIAFLNHKNSDQNDKALRKQIIESLIEETLIFNQGKKLNLSVSEDEFSQTLLYIMQQAQITQEELFKVLNNKIFDKVTLSNFVKYQIIMQQIIQKKLSLELKYSNAEKLSLREKNLKKMSHENIQYKIMLLSINNKITLQKEKFESCAQLEKFIATNNITKQTNDIFDIKDINSKLLKSIKSTNNDYGITNNQNKIIAFCGTKNQKKISNIPNETLDNIYKNELLLKAIKNNIDNLKRNNFILIKN